MDGIQHKHGLIRAMLASESRLTRWSLVLGLAAIVLMIALVGIGVVRQDALSENMTDNADSGRIIVQLQRETLRLLTLVRSEPDLVTDEERQLQSDLLESRFKVASHPGVREGMPASILPRLEGIEDQWRLLQPILDAWQEDPTDEEIRYTLGNHLAEMELAMNEAEINYQRERIKSISRIVEDGQRWLIALGLTALLIIVLIAFMANSVFRSTRRQQEIIAAEAAARESNRLKSEFLATMSHELRTPLNGVIGYADFLMTAGGESFNPKQKDYLQRILGNGERLLRLVDDILDVSRIESGRLELVDAPYSPSDLLESLKPDLQSMAARKNLEMVITADPALPPMVVGDRQRVIQMVTNLAWNAVKFTEKGKIDVTFRRCDEKVWSIVVSDTGAGIPIHAQEFIFEKFRQVDGKHDRMQGGAGLGLHIVRNIAVLMGGSVRVQSEVERGSTFTIDLPIRVPEGAKAESVARVPELVKA